MYRKTPKLTVVGAGPGDVDLITVKAIKVLKLQMWFCMMPWLMRLVRL